MNKFILPLLTIASIVSASSVDAQCRRFTRQRVISTLDQGTVIDQVTAGTLGRGESAATLLVVDAPGKVDLVISTHPDLGEVTYSVVDTQGKNYGHGQIRGQIERFPIETDGTSDLIVHIQSEKSTNAYAPLGCVALATTKSSQIKNDMDILTEN